MLGDVARVPRNGQAYPIYAIGGFRLRLPSLVFHLECKVSSLSLLIKPFSARLADM